MSDYTVTFARIGRSHGPFAETFSATSADDLAEQVFQYSRSKLGSKMFEVSVDLDGMVGSIEYGRFGTFTIDVVQP